MPERKEAHHVIPAPQAAAPARDECFSCFLIESAADAIIGFDAEDRIQAWNHGARDLYGYTAEEVRGRPFEILFPDDPRFREECWELTRSIVAEGVVRSRETVNRRKDGRAFPVLLTLNALHDGRRRYLGSSAVVKDLSEVKRLEQALIDQERLAAVGALAASIAHEIKNPLAAIGGAVEVLGRGFPETDARREVVREVLGQIHRLDALVRDLLLFARPGEMRLGLHDVHLLLDGALGMLREDPLVRGVGVVKEWDPTLPRLLVDEGQLVRVFVNVTQNACQAMGGRGTLTIRTFRTLPPPTGPGEGVGVSFLDTGPGIPADILSRIFEPFFTTKHRGTGLGLSIVRKIVEAHGGRIAASSTGGGGALFQVQLPLAPGDAEPLSPIPPALS